MDAPTDARPDRDDPLTGWSPRPFEPAWFLPGPHAQTVGGKMLRTGVDFPTRRERIETDDGDFLELEFGEAPSDADAPIGLVLHGLEGSARRPYALLTYRELQTRGLRPIGLHFRGCGSGPNLLPRFYHSGETGDLARVLRELDDRFPGVPVGVIGFSLGANVLLKYLGESGAESGVTAAVAISTPFDLDAGAAELDRTWMGSVYSYYFLRSLRGKVRSKGDRMQEVVDVGSVLSARTIREFDERATAVIHGFEGAEDYYFRSSSTRFVDRIESPTLLLQARDDPFLPFSAVPVGRIEENPALRLVLTEAGGHVGFVEADGWTPRFWAEAEAARFMEARLRR